MRRSRTVSPTSPQRWNPILDEFNKAGVRFALEVHPTEIAFDIVSAERALQRDQPPARIRFQFRSLASRLSGSRLRQVHLEIQRPHLSCAHEGCLLVLTPTEAGVFGGHTKFGDPRRFWEFRSLGRGSIKFEEILRALNQINYQGPLSVEWEDIGMDREHGATEAAAFLRKLDFAPSNVAFDAAFEKK